jgi:hypothetical protein
VKPVIETMSYALRKLHRPSLFDVDGAKVLRCVHCDELGPTSPSAAWPCPTIALAGAVMRGEA